MRWSAILLLAIPSLLAAQTSAKAAPTVTFTFDWASVEPHHYSIAIDSSGNAEYESIAKEEGRTSDPFAVKFTVSPETREHIFLLTRQLNYFSGDFEFRKHKIAASGEKTLAYADADKHFETRYNWSENPAMQQLTTVFQGISATLEAGQRLERLRRFDPLGLNDELKNLERLAGDRSAVELQLIAPTLQKIAEDSTVLNIARQRARHLLQMAGQ